MNREPPAAVKRQLRKEVGFGCPEKDCGCPYLTWHHFDPRWEEKEHHNPEGMISLCRVHHDQADGGSYTKEQLRFLKANPSTSIEGKFNWMRNSLILATGSGYYYNPHVILNFKRVDIISFKRDERGYLLMNVNLLGSDGKTKFFMEDNVWSFNEIPEDLESPPSGKFLNIKYSNGDKIQIEFREFQDQEEFNSYYSVDFPEPSIFPITVVDVVFNHVASSTKFTASKSSVGGWKMKNIFSLSPVHTVFRI